MSARNRPLEKKVRRMRRALRKGRLPAHIDLIHWLKLHGYAQTTGAATKLIMDARVKSESHPLGIRTIDVIDKDTDEIRKVRMLDPLVPARLRGSIRVET